jgi:hypothetical protein
VVNDIAGFNIHRGCSRWPSARRRDSRGARPTGVSRMPCGVDNPDNVGGIFRAAAFSVELVVLGPNAATCARPCARRWRPRCRSLRAGLRRPRPHGHATAGFDVIALTPAGGWRRTSCVRASRGAAGGADTGLSPPLSTPPPAARIPMTAASTAQRHDGGLHRDVSRFGYTRTMALVEEVFKFHGPDESTRSGPW